MRAVLRVVAAAWLCVVQVLYHSLSLVIPDDGATDEALQALLDLAKHHPDSVPLTLAIATGYVKLGNIPRARTQLKRAQVRARSHAAHAPATRRRKHTARAVHACRNAWMFQGSVLATGDCTRQGCCMPTR